MKKRMINLTAHEPTGSMRQHAEFIQVTKEDRKKILSLLNFKSLDEAKNSIKRAFAIHEIIKKYNPQNALLGGAFWLTADLTYVLSYNCISCYGAFSKRRVVEEKLNNNKVIKKSIFVFEGFVPLNLNC